MEIWKPVIGYETRYLISNKGNLRSLGGSWVNKKGTVVHFPPKPIKLVNTLGYKYANLCLDGVQKPKKIHRLVAQAFIPNPLGKKHINHIDGNKANNCVENLEWCTSSENLIHAYRTGLHMPKKREFGDNPRSKKIMDIETGVIYNSINHLASHCKIPRTSLVRKIQNKKLNKYRFL